MVAKKVSQQQVFAVAHMLSEKGIKPTAKKLLSEIGMGSLTTHSKHLKQWQQLNDKDDNQLSSLSSTVTGLSSDIVALFQSAISQCWQQGYEQGQLDSQLHVEKLRQQLLQSQQAIEAAQNKLEKQTQQQSKLTKKSGLNKQRKPFQGLALGGYHASKDN